MFRNMMLLYYLGSGLGAVIVIVIIAAVISKFRKGSHSVLILQEFIFNEHEDVFLKIIGRESGFWNWLLSLINKAPITSFTCNKRQLKYEMLQYETLLLTSKIKYYIPMIKISCISSAMLNKFRWGLLILGIILFIAGIALPSHIAENSYRIVLVIVGIILFLCSFIKKRIMHFGIYLFTNNPMLTITLKKGIINSIENEAFEAAANTLNRIVLANAISK